MKLRRIFSLGGAFLLVLIKFAVDVIAKNVELDLGGMAFLRELIVAGVFVLLYLSLFPTGIPREQNAVKKLGLVLVFSAVALLAGIGISAITLEGFDAKNLSLLPLDYPTLFLGSLLSVVYGVFALFLAVLLRDLVLFHRTRGTRRNFLIFFGLVLATALSTAFQKPLDSTVTTTVLFGLAVVFAVVNSFRLPWIIYLSKREKIFALVYGFFLFFMFIMLDVLLAQSTIVNRSLLYYSSPLKQCIVLVMAFGTIYFGMTFVSTLFHLPTAEAFERKRSEVTSLHNLSRLVTQVFDFNELVETVTTMTLDVCEAKSCWLEIIHTEGEIPHPAGPDDASRIPLVVGGSLVQVVAMKNISQAQIDTLIGSGEKGLRDTVFAEKKPIVVDDLRNDPRFRHVRKMKLEIGSMVVAPLVSHVGLIGVLYATKEPEYGFVKDDVDVITAFADQATVAIENSRLIKKSIERERLLREILVAQEMQKRLLPQTLPSSETVEIDAMSTPAFEVGGDYYDFVHLDPARIGIVVGDVSGKGVSAAFYMSEVKGIFQALSRMYPSPKQFMVKANEALASSIDKHSFVSLIYGILNIETGSLTLSRAGHCPMLHVSRGGVQYIRPNGMGLGLTEGVLFEEVIEEHAILLEENDVCIFYTDGLTEARNGEEEFGYERLLAAALEIKDSTAHGIKDHILNSVQSFIGQDATHDDDLTLVVLKWRGRPTGK